MAYLVADLTAQLAGKLFGDALSQGNSSDSPRLRDAHEQRRTATFTTVVAELPGARLGSLVNELRDLSRLPASSLTADYRDHEVLQVFHYFTLVEHDWQLLFLLFLGTWAAVWMSWLGLLLLLLGLVLGSAVLARLLCTSLFALSSYICFAFRVVNLTVYLVDEREPIVIGCHLLSQLVV